MNVNVSSKDIDSGYEELDEHVAAVLNFANQIDNLTDLVEKVSEDKSLTIKEIFKIIPEDVLKFAFAVNSGEIETLRQKISKKSLEYIEKASEIIANCFDPVVKDKRVIKYIKKTAAEESSVPEAFNYTKRVEWRPAWEIKKGKFKPFVRLVITAPKGIAYDGTWSWHNLGLFIQQQLEILDSELENAASLKGKDVFDDDFQKNLLRLSERISKNETILLGIKTKCLDLIGRDVDVANKEDRDII